MNERIRQLAEQATKHYPATESSGEFSTFDKELFAELVVRECRYMFVVNSPSWNLLNEKLELFGVEEC